MRTVWSFHSAGSLVFGRGAILRLGEIVRKLPAKRVLIVTDAVLVRAGVVEPALGSLREAGVAVALFDGATAEAPMSCVEKCLDAVRSGNPDAFVAIGGGAAMDVAKMAATVAAHGGDVRKFLGDDQIPGPIMPLVCVATTAGTGSEVSGAAALTDTENRVKVGCLSNTLRPRAAIVDPALTHTCPTKVTADSGIDALTHAVEAFTAVDNATFPLPAGERSVYQGRHPMGDVCAGEAIRLCGRFLRRAVANGQDADARDGMALAATLAGLAFSNVGVALVHALEYPVGGATGCSHGEGNGLLLPFVMRFNSPTRLKELKQVAEWLGEDVASLDDKSGADRAVRAVEKMLDDIKIPRRLRDFGVKHGDLAGYAERAFAIKRILRVNPRQVTQADCEELYREAW